MLERGANPNDEEVPYHAPETYDNDALALLVESGRLTDDNLTTMLLRKADWHDGDGIEYLLAHGADPNRMTRWGYTALQQAVRRDNALRSIELMVEHGADPTLTSRHDNCSVIATAARRGRGDVLLLLESRGLRIELPGVDRLIAACARNDADQVQSIRESEPQLVADLRRQGGTLLAEFSGNGNADGARLLLDLGIAIDAMYGGDGYFGIPPMSTALHVAAWRARHDTVRFLIGRGAAVDVKDAHGQTPLALAVRACVDSYWMNRRSPESVDALLRAGASTKEISCPSGYAEVDDLLRSHGGDGPPLNQGSAF